MSDLLASHWLGSGIRPVECSIGLLRIRFFRFGLLRVRLRFFFFLRFFVGGGGFFVGIATVIGLVET